MRNVILKPILTEKMNVATEKYNRYGFVVNKTADKAEIKSAIEKLYNVEVATINTMNYGGGKKSMKHTNRGIVYQKPKAFKKAIVTVKDGDVIDLYENI
jgi:large subunit ribosomal protein L23